MIRIKRVYDKAGPEDGFRVFVERFWPRDLTEKHAKLDLWLKDVAPSEVLHRTFGEDPNWTRWDEFQRLYRSELDNKHKSLKLLREKNRDGVLTLLHAAHDENHSGATVLKQLLEGGSASV
ncbi:MAG TPA: DUF488 family protein [Planctomycetaceae bacterium]|nr:DUF488 family protein [Planctomycetaceae bacterium]